ncbi:MAG: beta-ketoacyl synthase chain length factor [Campylobacter sp.]|nr:beta-ketoacyl synthase chain length factor [Campylobacter sp.]
MRAVSFNIERINALSIGSNWDKEPDVSRVAPIARRRLSRCAKLIFGVTSDICLDVPIVFSSNLGEINRCCDLLSTLKNEVSPTSFSLSVLNAVPALLSIEAKNHNGIFAISAKAGFEYAVLNALKFERAVAISYFESVDREYFKLNKPFNIAIGAVITKGDEYELSYELSDQKADISEVSFLENFKQKSEWINHDGVLAWKWRRNR